MRKMEGMWCQKRSSNPEGKEGESQDDDKEKLLGSSWEVGPGRTKDPRNDLSKKEKKEKQIHLLIC